MRSVDELVADIIRREGGFNDIKEDRGGSTQYGVSLRYARGIGLDLDHDGDVDTDDIRLVTPQVAAQLYKDDFMHKPGIDRLPGELHAQLVDCAVNHGPPRAVKFLQHVLVQAGFLPEIGDNGRAQDDGVIGRKTVAAAEQAQAQMGPFLTNAIVEERLGFFDWIVSRRPDQVKFLKGWRNRANEFRVAT